MADDIGNAQAGASAPAQLQLDGDMFEGVLTALSTGGNIDDEIVKLQSEVHDAVVAAGGSEAAAEHAGDVFASTFRTELFDGNLPMADAADYAQQAMNVAMTTFDPSAQVIDPAAALLSAIASGQGVDGAVADVVAKMLEDGDLPADPAQVETVFLEELQNALARGEDPQQALEEANEAAQSSIAATEQTEVPVDNPILSALAGGDNVKEALGDAANAAGGDGKAFVDGLEASLADGAGVGDAMADASQAAEDSAAAKEGAKVELSAADKLAQALASGEEVSEALGESGGGDAFASTLEDALANGSDAGDAMAQADEAQTQQQAQSEAQSVPLSAADQLAASLASGDNVDEVLAKAGGDDAFAEALQDSLAQGESPDSAMESGQQAATAAAETQQSQSVPVSAADQLAASLASGENVADAIEEAGGGEAFGEELADALASGESPAKSLAEAESAKDAAESMAEEQAVPADPVAAALAQGGDTAGDVDLADAVAQATDSTGGESAGDAAAGEPAATETAAAEPEQTEQSEASAETEKPAANSEPETVQTASAEPEAAPSDSEPAAETTSEPAAEPTNETAAEPAAEPTTETASEPAAEPTTETAAEPADEPAAEPEQTEVAAADAETQSDETQNEEPQTKTEDGEGKEEVAAVSEEAVTEEGAAGENAVTGENDVTGEGVTETIETASAAPAVTETPEEGEGGGSDELTDEEIDALQDISTAAGGNQPGQGGSGVSFESAKNATNIGGSDSPLGGTFTPPTVPSTGPVGSSQPSSGGSDDSGPVTGGAGDDTVIVNVAPTANADAAAGTENQTLTLNVLANDSDPDGPNLTVTAASVPIGQGVVSIVGGNIEFEPGTDFDDLDVGDEETVTINYSVNDGAGGTASSTVTVTVTGTNDTPTVALADSDVTGGVVEQNDNTDKGATELSVSGEVTFEDLDADGTHTVSAPVAVGGAAGEMTAVISADAKGGAGTIKWTYTANEASFDALAEGETTTETFEFTVRDDVGATVTQSVTVTITGTNDSPIAQAEIAGTTENTSILIDVLANDSDVDTAQDNLTLTAATVPDGQGTAAIEDGKVRFNPGADFETLGVGQTQDVVISYSITDDFGAKASSQVTVTVTGTNDAPTVSEPVPVADATQDSDVVEIALLTGASDVDAGDDLDTDSVAVQASDSRVVDFSVDNETGAFILDPTQFADLDDGEQVDLTVSFNVVDGNGGVTPNTASFSVTGSNDAPTVSFAGGEGGVLNLNGTDAFVELPRELASDLTAGTIETWVFLDSSSNETIFSNQSNGVNSVAIFQVGQSGFTPIEPGQLSFFAQNGTGFTSNATLTTGEWHHVAVAFDANGAQFYIDGQPDASAAGNFSLPNVPVSGGGVAIGAWLGDGQGQFFDGNMGEFRVWETRRSDAEIADNFETALNGDEEGLRALYDFNVPVGSGGTVDDLTGSFDGVSGNATTTTDASFPIGSGIVGDEDTPISLSGLSVFDGDGEVVTVTLTGGDNGVLSVTGVSDDVVAGNGSSVMTLTGTSEVVNDAIQSLTYTGAADFNGTTSVAVSITDGDQTVNETLTVEVNPVDDAPTVSALNTPTLIAPVEEFSDGAEGWSNAKTASDPAYSTMLGTFATGEATEKTFTVPADTGAMTIAFDFHRIDSWDGETFSVLVNGETIASRSFTQTGTGSDSVFTATTEGNVNLGFTGHFSDQSFTANITLTAAQVAALPDDGNGGKSLTLGFTSTLDQGANDESWGVDNITLLGHSPDAEVDTAEGTLNTNLLAGVNDVEGGAITVQNVVVTASDGREVAFEIDADTGEFEVDLTQFSDLEIGNDAAVLSVSYDVNDGTSSTPNTASFVIQGVNDAPVITGITGNDTVVSFDGVDDDMRIAHSDDMNFHGNTPVTVEMWVNPDDVSGLTTLFDKSVSGSSDTTAFRFHIDNGKIVVYNNAGGVVHTSDVVVSTGEWTHVAVAFDGESLSILVNGEAQTLNTGGTTRDYTLGTENDGDIRVGDDNQASRNFNGDIADLRIWNVGRTEEEVQSTMDGSIPDPENVEGLIGYYAFDSVSGGQVQDLSGNDNDLSFGTGPTASAYLLFDGNTNNVELDDTTGTLRFENGFTFQSWVRMDELSPAETNDNSDLTTLAGRFGVPEDERGFLVEELGAGHLRFVVGDGLAVYETDAAVLSTGDWAHVTVTYDTASGAVFYIDGEAVPSSQTTGDGTHPTIPVDTGPITFADMEFDTSSTEDGSHDRHLNGGMSEIALFTRAIDAIEVSASFDAGLSGSEADLVALLSASNTDGQNLFDASGNGNDATLGFNASAGVNDPTIVSDGPSLETVSNDGLPIDSDVISTGMDEAVSGQILTSDDENEAITVSKEADPDNGTLSVSGDGSYTYTPRSGFTGNDSFQVRLTDASGTNRVETIVVSVDNSAPALDPNSNAFSFDGSTNIVIGDDNTLDVTSTFTIEMWVKPESGGTLFSKDGVGSDTTGAYNLALIDPGNGDGLTLEYETNNTDGGISVANVVTVGDWNHLAASYDNGIMTLYVNGIEVHQAESTEPSVLSTDLVLGRRGFDGDPKFFSGDMNDVRLWDVARSGDDILADMNMELTGTETGLVGNWSFNEADGGTVLDKSVNGNDGVVSGTADRSNLVDFTISNNEVYKGLLLGSDPDGDQLSYAVADGPDHGTVSFDGAQFVYEHAGDGQSDSFTVQISDGTETITEQIDVNVI